MEFTIKEILHNCRYYKMMKFYRRLKNDPTNEKEFVSLLNVLFTIRLFPSFGYDGYLFHKLMEQIKILHNDFVLFLNLYRSLNKQTSNNRNPIVFYNVYDEYKTYHKRSVS